MIYVLNEELKDFLLANKCKYREVTFQGTKAYEFIYTKQVQDLLAKNGKFGRNDYVSNPVMKF